MHSHNRYHRNNTFGDFSYIGDDSKLVLVLVGLPARGKTFIARKISSYLSWLGIKVRWFNVGYYRRLCATNTVGTSSASFFDPTNEAATKQRELFALLALAELEKYLREGGQVAILDGTNTTKARRSLIKNFFARNPHAKRKRNNNRAHSSHINSNIYNNINNSNHNRKDRHHHNHHKPHKYRSNTRTHRNKHVQHGHQHQSKKHRSHNNTNHINHTNHTHQNQERSDGSSYIVKDLNDPHYRDSESNRNNNQDRSHGGNNLSNHFGDVGNVSPVTGNADISSNQPNTIPNINSNINNNNNNNIQTIQGTRIHQHPTQSHIHHMSNHSTHRSHSRRTSTKSADTAINSTTHSSSHLRSNVSVASNGSSRNKEKIFEELDGSKVQIIFIESICNDPVLIEQNIIKVKLTSPDYADVPPQEAVRDFKRRIKHYEKVYEPVDETDGSYIKMINAGKHIVGHEVNGYLSARILYFLMHLNLEQVPIFLSRHGESEFNIENRIGGNASLSPAGRRYSQTMCDFITLQPEFRNGMNVWCSTLKRTMETAEPFRGMCPIQKWKALGEIEAGICDGMTYYQIKMQLPSEWNSRKMDKLGYRYPQGESYKDVISRLEPVIFELERATQPVLVISHRAVLICLYAYFMDKPLKDIPYLPMELHTVYKLKPSDYKTEMDKFTFGFLASRTAPSSIEKDTYFDDIDNNPPLNILNSVVNLGQDSQNVNNIYKYHNKMRKKYKLLKATDSDDSDNQYNSNANVTPLTMNNINNNNNNGENFQTNGVMTQDDSKYAPNCNVSLSWTDLKSAPNNSNVEANGNNGNNGQNNKEIVQGYERKEDNNETNNQNINNNKSVPLSRYSRNQQLQHTMYTFRYHKSKQFGDQMMDGRSVADSVDSGISNEDVRNGNIMNNGNNNNNNINNNNQYKAPMIGPASQMKARKSDHDLKPIIGSTKSSSVDKINNINTKLTNEMKPSRSESSISEMSKKSISLADAAEEYSNNKSRKSKQISLTPPHLSAKSKKSQDFDEQEQHRNAKINNNNNSNNNTNDTRMNEMNGSNSVTGIDGIDVE